MSIDSSEKNYAGALLHELANDLAAIQMRADILIRLSATSEASMTPLMQADIVTIRATAADAITIADQLTLLVVAAEHSVLGSDEV